MNTILRGLLAVLTVVVSACASSTAPGEADLAGTVLEVAPQGAYHIVRIMRSGTTASGPESEALVHVTGTTPVLIPSVEGVAGGTITDLRVGTRVRVKTTGVEYRSLPPQYRAVWVELDTVR